jgi:flagellin
MSLGVLNNLNAIYAENNLNSTSTSLSKVLQQLSSGSKINSGSDDAAGLSLVNGLAANASALSQSETNATEGSGLLQVADGALSQVTSLLNRAVTLATEASNGTLNSSQDTAANQEYQSILSEISNIGSTTTYNGKTVFGSTTNIYTGDSTSTGASVDKLTISSLSSANVGDTNGKMAYSSGTSVFLNLSSSTENAQSTDGIKTGGALTITYENADGTTGTASIKPSAANDTVNGLISAINSSGLGLTATFTTAGAAKDTTASSSSMTGIQITGAVNITAVSTSSDMIAQDGTTAVTDSSTNAGTLEAGGTGTATISYSDSAGTDLSGTKLDNQSDAQSALTALNAAITNVAAQDGYLGAQINTLNSVSSVLSTQSENVTSAQNAVQSTDYASATSDMSKYEILSQTGISALAQANSVQQEVTKLLQ